MRSGLTSRPAWTPANARSGQVGSFILRLRGDLEDRVRAPQALLQGKRVTFDGRWVKDPGLTSLLTRHRAVGVRQLFIQGGTKPPAKLAHSYRIEVAAGMTAGALQSALDELNRSPQVLHAEPNPRMRALETVPNDPLFVNQWHLREAADHDIDATEAWDLSIGSSSTLIAVLDTGVDATHPDLGPAVVGGFDFVNGDSDASDDHGHGTHVAGIIAATANNGVGATGIDWSSRILPVKVLDDQGDGDLDTVAEGIAYAVSNGAKVINLSLGGLTSTSLLADAVAQASAAGAVVVAAAGNDNTEDAFYPSAYPEVIGVAATNARDAKASFSSFGERVDISAPGEAIWSTVSMGSCSLCSPDGYAPLSGTSMATPVIAGVLGLLHGGSFTNITRAERMQRLLATADSIAALNPEHRNELGVGRVNARAALEAAVIPLRVDFASQHLLLNGSEVSELPTGQLKLVIGLQAMGPTLSNVVATLSTADPQVHLTSAVSSYGTLPFYAEIENAATPFVFSVDPGMFPGHRVELALRVQGTGPGSGYDRSFPIVLRRPWPELPGFPVALPILPGFGTTGANPIVFDLIVRDDHRPEIIVAGGLGGALGRTFAFDSAGTLLPGWPVQGTPGHQGSLAVVDVNPFGRGEVFFADDQGFVRGYDSYGAPRPGFPIDLSLHFGSAQTSVLAGTAVADLDQDGVQDLVTAAGRLAGGENKLFAFDVDGGLRAGWPVSVDDLGFEGVGEIRSRPAVGDIDGDGRKEIFFGTGFWDNDLAVRDDGSLLWPIAGSPELGPVRVSPILADLNQDGRLEYVSASQSSLVVRDHTGTLLPGWPLALNGLVPGFPFLAIAGLAAGDVLPSAGVEIVALGSDGNTMTVVAILNQHGVLVGQMQAPGLPSSLDASALVGDLDGDDGLDVVASVDQGVDSWTYAWRSDGTLLDGFPLSDFLGDSSTVADVNSDGLLDLVRGAASRDSPAGLHAYATAFPYNLSFIDWPTTRSDPRSSGVLHDQAPPELLRINVSPQKLALGKKAITVTFTIDAFDRGGFGTSTPSTIQVHRPDFVTYPVPLQRVGSDPHSSRLRGTFVVGHGDPLGLYRFSLSLIDAAMNERLWWSSELHSLGFTSDFVAVTP